jgi:hypothetical protein
MMRIERSLEETKAGLRVKEAKTKHGKRTISLPHSSVAVLREYRRKLPKQRMVLGIERPDGDTLHFGELDGSPRRPDRLSWLWRSAGKSLKLPLVSFHAPHPPAPLQRIHHSAVRSSPAHRYFRPHAWSRSRFFPYHCRST